MNVWDPYLVTSFFSLQTEDTQEQMFINSESNPMSDEEKKKKPINLSAKKQ